MLFDNFAMNVPSLIECNRSLLVLFLSPQRSRSVSFFSIGILLIAIIFHLLIRIGELPHLSKSANK